MFDKLRAAKLKLHPAKCHWFSQKVNFLGHVITPEGVMPNEDKLEKLKTYPCPTNQRQVRQFLGFCNYYRRFCRNYSKIAAPLNELLRKDVAFIFTDAAKDAFEKLRDALVNAPLLHYPQMDREFIISTDCSSYALGYILSQIDDKGREIMISFGGRALRDGEKNFSVSELEGLALVCAIREYHPYISNRHFKVLTDHLSLQFLKNMKNARGRLVRWSILLQGYDFTVEYKPGKKHTNVDALSRLENYPVPPEVPADDPFLSDTVFLRSVIPASTCAVDFEYADSNDSTPQPDDDEEPDIELADLINQQRQCSDYSGIIAYIEDGILPVDNAEARRVVLKAEQYIIQDKVLYHLHHPRRKQETGVESVTPQIAVPHTLRQQVLISLHDNLAHAGFDRLYSTVRRRFHWPKLYVDTHQYVATCVICQQSKRQIHPNTAPLHSLPIVDVMSRLHIDILGPISPATKEGYRYILICIDSLSGWPEAIPLVNQEASVVAKALYENVFTRYGSPRTLLSDRGQNFMSALVSELCKLFNVHKTFTSSYHAQTNSKAERINSYLWQSIRAYCTDKEQWSDFLPAILMAYRATVSVASTSFSPHFVLFGREMRLPLPTALSPKPTGKITADQYVAELLPKLELTRKIAQENLDRQHENSKERFDKSARPTVYSPGTRVWLYDPKTKPGVSPKICRKFVGPYYVVARGPKDVYYLRRCSDNKSHSAPIHSNRLRPFNDDRDELMTRWSSHSQSGEDSDVEHDSTTQLPDTSEDTTQTQEVSPSTTTTATASEWHDVEKLLACKTINGKKHYRVKWADKNAVPSWEPTENVSDCLKREFHVKKTMDGRKRKRLLHPVDDESLGL